MNNRSSETSRSVHLSASAGSGKTRALKERYLALLDLLDGAGLGIDQAVAITFTDKAAAEIKERVLRDLPEAMLRKIVRGSQDLRISTIHSFCMHLLKRYPLEAGLPPDFGVLDSRDQADRLEQAVLDALEDADRDGECMEPLRSYRADDLIAAILYLLSIRSKLKRLEIDAGGPEEFLGAVTAGRAADNAEQRLRDLVGSREWRSRFSDMETLLRAQPDSYAASQGAAHRLLAETADAALAAGTATALLPVYFTKDGRARKNPFIAKSAFSGKDRKPYEEGFAAIQELLGELREWDGRLRSGREALSLLRVYLLAEERYRLAKLREGMLDFDDLEIHAYRLLKSATSPDILYWLDRKILHFLVDEFQDTSDIQWAILDTLTAEIFAGRGADKPLRPTLFVVGDRKQSIYRFREANYRLIDDVREKMLQYLPAEARAVRTLDRNFRSAPEVVGSVNRVFSALWRDEYVPSDAERRDHEGSVELIEIVPAEEQGITEADVLAQEIRKTIDAKTPVYEQRDGPWIRRAAGYGDCAVLIQSRTKLKEYEQALQRADVPFRVVGGIGFYEQDEIQAVLHVLFFLWNRDDRLSLAAALKSALFGLSEPELYELFAPGRDTLALLARRAPRVHALLEDWSRYAGTEPLAGLIHRIVLDAGAYVSFGRRNAQAVFNLDKLLDTAREFDRRGYTTLQDFVEWVKSIREAEQREATADMNLPGFEGAVSIMTVHKAKGLEFPLLFLPGMNQQPRSVSHGPALLVASDPTVRLAVKAAGGVYGELWETEQEELRREHQRLLYVAMTRARDRLVMIATLEEGTKPVREHSWLSFLRRAVPAEPETTASGVLRSSYPAWNREPTTIDPAVRTAGSDEGSLERIADPGSLTGQLGPLPASAGPAWKKATDFIGQEKEWFAEHPAPRQPGGISPLTRGTFLHRCLELHTTCGAADPAVVAQEFPEIDGLEQTHREAFLEQTSALLAAVTGTPELGWIFEQTPQSYSELPFLARKGSDIVSGVIDRLVVRNGIVHVIDYKSIALHDDEDLAAWKDHYLPQLRIYCEAAKELFGIADVQGHLLFLDSIRLERAV